DVYKRQETKSEELAGIEHGNGAAYKYINFGEKGGPKEVIFRVAPEKTGGQIAIRIDKPWGEAIVRADIPPGDGRTWMNLSFPVKEVTGIHPIWLYFSGAEGQLMKLDWFEFKAR
ncbi:MAG: carbohydrate-binding protein, partial [Candidatus Aminicenantes bacterium]|nr:carbohydrate-binding protein [Candidatus Aminicenantes bacterium]